MQYRAGFPISLEPEGCAPRFPWLYFQDARESPSSLTHPGHGGGILIPKNRRKLLGYLIIIIMGFILSRYIATRIKSDLQRTRSEAHQGAQSDTAVKADPAGTAGKNR